MLLFFSSASLPLLRRAARRLDPIVSQPLGACVIIILWQVSSVSIPIGCFRVDEVVPSVRLRLDNVRGQGTGRVQQDLFEQRHEMREHGGWRHDTTVDIQ